MYPERNRKDKTALITGAASGLGFAFADNLAKQGYNLLVVDIQEDKMYHVAKQFRSDYHVEVYVICLDLSRIDAAETVYAFCRKHRIDIHILINNAGCLVFDAITAIDDDKYNAFLQLHLNTPAKLCKLFGGDMKARREGYMLIVSSLAAWMPYPYLSLYASTKQFLRTFAKSVHFEFSDCNVGVTVVCPGAVDTQLFDLKPKLRKIAKNIGVMITPDLLAQRSLKKMFHNRKSYIPGLINKLSIPLIMLLPVRLLVFFYKKITL